MKFALSGFKLQFTFKVVSTLHFLSRVIAFLLFLFTVFYENNTKVWFMLSNTAFHQGYSGGVTWDATRRVFLWVCVRMSVAVITVMHTTVFCHFISRFLQFLWVTVRLQHCPRSRRVHWSWWRRRWRVGSGLVNSPLEIGVDGFRGWSGFRLRVLNNFWCCVGFSFFGKFWADEWLWLWRGFRGLHISSLFRFFRDLVLWARRRAVGVVRNELSLHGRHIRAVLNENTKVKKTTKKVKIL